MKSLYAIDEQIRQVLDLYVDMDTGAIEENGLELLAKLEKDRDECLLNTASYVKELRARAAALKEIALNRTVEAKHAEHKADKLVEFIAANAEPGVKLQNEDSEIAWRLSPGRLVLTDIDAAMEAGYKIEFEPVTPEPVVDKAKLKKDLAELWLGKGGKPGSVDAGYARLDKPLEPKVR